jgi:hypothetical protein
MRHLYFELMRQDFVLISLYHQENAVHSEALVNILILTAINIFCREAECVLKQSRVFL